MIDYCGQFVIGVDDWDYYLYGQQLGDFGAGF